MLESTLQVFHYCLVIFVLSIAAGAANALVMTAEWFQWLRDIAAKQKMNLDGTPMTDLNGQPKWKYRWLPFRCAYCSSVWVAAVFVPFAPNLLPETNYAMVGMNYLLALLLIHRVGFTVITKTWV